MASPQIENGFTKIANELLEQLAITKLSPTQYRIVLAIWRSTYGFNKKDHEISLTFLAEATGTNKQQVKKELDKLIERKVVTVTKEGSYSKPRKLAFNKYYNEWVCLQSTKKETVSVEADSTVSDGGYTTVSPRAYTTVSDGAYQKINNKEIYKHKESVDDSSLLFDEFWKVYPKKTGKKAAKEMFGEILNEHPYETIMNGLKGYKERCESEGIENRFIQSPKNFLHQETFLDYQPKEKREVGTEVSTKARIAYLQDGLSLGFGYYQKRGIEDDYYSMQKELEELEQL